MCYSPYAELVEMSGRSPMFGFTGEQQNFSNNLVYLRARYYNPALGRFLTPDSLIPDVTNGQSLNAYVYNDPINLVDPTGNIPNVGDAIVNVAKRLPASWQSNIKGSATAGLNGLDAYFREPDACSCSRQPKGFPDVAITGANYAVQAYWGGRFTTSFARMGTHVVERFSFVTGSWELAMQPRSLNVTKLTWRMSAANRFDAARVLITGKAGTLMRGQGLERQLIRHMRIEPIRGFRGWSGGLFGAGIIDGITQGISDWNAGLCLSRAQQLNRIALAVTLGLAAAAIGGLFAIPAAALGASAGVVALTGVGASFLASLYFSEVVKPKTFIGSPHIFGG